MSNAEIALHFDELADLYELDGAIVHRVLAYRTAAKAVRESSQPVAELVRAGRATEIPGIGKTLAEKLAVLLETGTIPSAERLKAKFPPGLIEVARLPGLGPKRVRRLFDELGVDSIAALREAVQHERLRSLPGFGAKAEENIRLALETYDSDSARPRMLLSRALELGEALVSALREVDGAERVELAGSARRMAETCKDLDIVATSHDPDALAAAFAALPLLASVDRQASAGVRAVTHNGMPVDLRIVAPGNFGNLLQHFTGSGRHNEALRRETVTRGLHVSEYGVIDDATQTTHACATEEDVYALLDMEYIEPELREDRGELQAARNGTLPKLVRAEDIRGDLHCHTVASDGRQTIEQMAVAARGRGYEYIAITDHSATHGFGNDVSPDELRRQIERVREVNATDIGISVLAGSEVNVLPDGALDYDDELLAELDWVIASVHSSFRLSEQEQTERMLRAIEHPLVDAIGHPTGRLIDRRRGYSVDIHALAERAASTGTLLEVNGNPDRRDLSELNIRTALDAGAALVIDSDAHGTNTLANIRYGIATARRGWAEAAQVANTLPWAELAARRRERAAA